MVRCPSAVATAKGRKPLVSQEPLADLDRVLGPRRVEQDVGEQQLGLEPFRIGPGDGSGRLQEGDRLVPLPGSTRVARQANQQPKLMIAGRAGQGNSVDRLIGSRLLAGLPVRVEGKLIATDRLRRTGEPEVVRRLIRETRDFLAIALDQAAVLAKDDQSVSLCHDQVAVAGDQVPTVCVVGLLKFDRGLDTQSGPLIEDLDLVLGRPVDQVAGQEPTTVALQRLARIGPGAEQPAVLDVKQKDAIPSGHQPPLGHSQTDATA